MKFNKKKFFKNLFLLILFICLVLAGVYLWKTPEARENIYRDYSDIAAIGTVADVMPIIGENRAIVRYGMERSMPTVATAVLPPCLPRQRAGWER